MPTCMNCQSTAVADIDGTLSCTNCGYVVDEVNIVNEIGFADAANGASTVIGQFISAAGPRALSMGTGRGMPQGHSRNSREVTLSRGKQAIARIAQQLPNLQQISAVLESATKLYQHAVEHKFIQGRKCDNVAAACLYIACRRASINQLLIDFSDVLRVNVFVLGNVVVRFAQRLNLRLPLTDPSLYMDRFANELELGTSAYPVASTALRILSHMRRDWIVTGRRPAGICGACLLVAARIHNFDRSESEVARVVRISEVTLQRRITEFSATPTVDMLTDDIGEQARVDKFAVADGISMNPPAFIRADAAATRRAGLRALVMQRPNLAHILTISRGGQAAVEAATIAAEAAAAAAAAAARESGADDDAGAAIVSGVAPMAQLMFAPTSTVAAPRSAAAVAAAAGDSAPASARRRRLAAAAAASAATGSSTPALGAAETAGAADEDFGDVVRQIRAVLRTYSLLHELTYEVVSSAPAAMESAGRLVTGNTGMRAPALAGPTTAAVSANSGAEQEKKDNSSEDDDDEDDDDDDEEEDDAAGEEGGSRRRRRRRAAASKSLILAPGVTAGALPPPAAAREQAARAAHLRAVLGLQMPDADLAAVMDIVADDDLAAGAAPALEVLPTDVAPSDRVDESFYARERRRIAAQDEAYAAGLRKLMIDVAAYKAECDHTDIDTVSDDDVDSMIAPEEERHARRRMWLVLNGDFLRERERRRAADEAAGVAPRPRGGRRGPRAPEETVASRINVDIFAQLSQGSASDALFGGAGADTLALLVGDSNAAAAAAAAATAAADGEEGEKKDGEKKPKRKEKKAATKGDALAAPSAAAAAAAAAATAAAAAAGAGAGARGGDDDDEEEEEEEEATPSRACTSRTGRIDMAAIEAAEAAAAAAIASTTGASGASKRSDYTSLFGGGSSSRRTAVSGPKPGSRPTTAAAAPAAAKAQSGLDRSDSFFADSATQASQTIPSTLEATLDPFGIGAGAGDAVDPFAPAASQQTGGAGGAAKKGAGAKLMQGILGRSTQSTRAAPTGPQAPTKRARQE